MYGFPLSKFLFSIVYPGHPKFSWFRNKERFRTLDSVRTLHPFHNLKSVLLSTPVPSQSSSKINFPFGGQSFFAPLHPHCKRWNIRHAFRFYNFAPPISAHFHTTLKRTIRYSIPVISKFLNLSVVIPMLERTVLLTFTKIVILFLFSIRIPCFHSLNPSVLYFI